MATDVVLYSGCPVPTDVRLDDGVPDLGGVVALEGIGAALSSEMATIEVIHASPAKRRTVASVGGGGGGGGGGGLGGLPAPESLVWGNGPDGLYEIDPVLRPSPGPAPWPATPTSIPQKVAELLGPGYAGFRLSKAAAKAAGTTLGKHGAAIASAASAVAMGKATTKINQRYGLPLAVGSVLGAIDDLVDIYVDDKPIGGGKDGGPTLVTLQTAEEFVRQAKRAKAQVWLTRVNGTTKSTGSRVVVLRYTFSSGDPVVLWMYQEILREGVDGKFSIEGTLLEAMRKKR